jgi:ABC-type nitrate/sulfonate/bicarbonate transport system substrate-binding protein
LIFMRIRPDMKSLGSRDRNRLAAGLAAAASVVLVAGCGGAGGPGSAPAMTLQTNPDGTPKLHGEKIRIAVGAAPAVGDARVQLMVNTLNQWGAKASVVNQTGDPAAVRVVLSGDAEIASIAVPGAISSGLKVFGPSQPRLDYDFVGAPGLKAITSLPGKTYGTSNTHGVEALSFSALLSKNKIDPASVTVISSGGAGERVSAMLAGRLDATFVHADAVRTLMDQGFNDLAKMSEAAPELADSFLSSSTRWLDTNPALAIAIDEAWIKAAQTFNTDKNAWVAAATSYSKVDKAEAEANYDALKSADTFPAAKSAFSKDSAVAQEKLAAEVGAIKDAPPADKWLTTDAWDKATAALGVS